MLCIYRPTGRQTENDHKESQLLPVNHKFMIPTSRALIEIGGYWRGKLLLSSVMMMISSAWHSGRLALFMFYLVRMYLCT